ncbi:hypothetical protein [Geminicoccus harenae]|uniref:hypothetical protein n=1 Tax=Geminicoccus harenae TaxID=2498453 RepID=UPI00168A8954|nr:hypothetical protein [Geminicoccus harenae]
MTGTCPSPWISARGLNRHPAAVLALDDAELNVHADLVGSRRLADFLAHLIRH